MDYTERRAHIRGAYLKSCLEIEVHMSRDLKTEIKNVKNGIMETRKRNISLEEKKMNEKSKEFFWGDKNLCHRTVMDETIKQMEVHLNFMKTEKTDYLKKMETITNGYDKAAAVIDEGGRIVNFEHIQTTIQEIESSIELKKGEISDRQLSLGRARKEWVALIKEKKDLYELLCQLEGEQNKLLSGDSQPTADSREDENASPTTTKPDSSTDELWAVIEMLRNKK